MDNSQYKETRLNTIPDTEISANLFNAVIGFVLSSGVFLNMLMAKFFTEPILSMPPAAIIAIYFVGTIGCMLIIYKSPNPMISYMAFLGLSASMGLLITWFIASYEVGTVSMAFFMTGIITVLMMLVSSSYPQFFLGLGRVLFLSLIGIIIVEVIFRVVIGFQMGFMDYIVALLFTAYIGYDWAKAQMYPKTFDNAVDCAADIYVDIVNLFIRLLAILDRQ